MASMLNPVPPPTCTDTELAARFRRPGRFEDAHQPRLVASPRLSPPRTRPLTLVAPRRAQVSPLGRGGGIAWWHRRRRPVSCRSSRERPVECPCCPHCVV